MKYNKRPKADYLKSLAANDWNTGKEYEVGKRLLLDGKYRVVVVKQRPLRNFTTVKTALKSFEVETDRLTELN